MTEWVNMFDAGACTVACRLKNPSQDTVLWSGTLGKGDSSPTFPWLNSSGDPFGSLQIDVDSSGVVSLSSPDDSITSAATNALTVAPQYDVSARQTQIVSASMPGGASESTAFASNDGDVNNEGGNAVSMAIGASGVLTPDNAQFTALADASLALYWSGS